LGYHKMVGQDELVPAEIAKRLLCGKREGKVSVLKGLANALKVNLDDLV